MSSKKVTSHPPFKLNLELAWRRMKQDRPDRCFVTHPYLVEWIESELSAWLSSIEANLPDSYTPQDPALCYSPKAGWMVRPGAVLTLADELIFNAIIGSLYSKLWERLSEVQGDPDIAYQLRKDPDIPAWVSSGFFVWKQWREKSLHRSTQQIRYVVFSDIAGFYGNIDLNILYSDLNSLGTDVALLDLLRKCLERWSRPRGRGIPQGYTASDFLAKLYMHPIDLGLRNSGFNHLRYVDDIRIFCKDRLEAKKALLRLTDLLRNRGLSLQTSKTEILPVDKARDKIDGVGPLIENIQEQLKDELRESYEGTYATVDSIEEHFATHPDSAPPEVLEEAFRKEFSPFDDSFDQSLFHYLLTRLGKTKSRIAAKYCLKLVRERPEETEPILRYLKEIGPKTDECRSILTFAASKDMIYDYQLYQILRWFFERDDFPKQLLSLCRALAFDKNRAAWVRSYAIAVVGEVGDSSDLETIEANYTSALTEVEKSEIVRTLARMELARRNAFFKRVVNDGLLVAAAIRQVKLLG
jgi:hypothetical protein